MATIKAPFNFVPLSEKVFFPEWADQISHDIPFEDGESGTIELKITAETPIFVRNGHTKEEAEKQTDSYKSFSNINGRYFIPATSIKGAIRNVLEIMSFGKIRLDESSMFAQREWDNENLYPMKKEQNNLLCGYLKRQGTEYSIVDCGKPYRIGHKRIDEKLGQPVFENNFSQNKGIDLNKEIFLSNKKFDPKTAIYKYELLKQFDLLEKSKFDYDTEYCNEYKGNRLIFSSNGKFVGRLVLTGQPDKWAWPRPKQLTKNAGKYYEFVFLQPEKESIIELSENEFKHFKFIYLESPEWERAKILLEKEGIPVFFRKDKKGRIKDIGLAFLYKLPYDKSPFDTLSEDHRKENKQDMADCLFGFTNNGKALKGRVQFSAAFSKNAKEDDNVILTLGGPKASYYPIYIKQDGSKGTTLNYDTYNNGKLSGWKRYLVRKNIWGAKEKEDPNLDTIIKPVGKGAVFIGKIRFHNLKKEELGALLSALTFHNTENCFHQIGQGKPYGFGKAKIEILLPQYSEQQKIHFMASFEEAVSKKISDWPVNNSIVQLFTISKEEVIAEDVLFKYMHMDNVKTKNEFITAKSFNEFLQVYSILINATHNPNSLIADIKLQREKELECQRIAEQNRIEEVLKQIKEENEKLAQDNLLKKIEEGLSFLDEKNIQDNFKVNDFKGARNRIDQWMKKVSVSLLPESQEGYLKKTLIRLFQKPEKKEKSEWVKFDSTIWKTITVYIGAEKALLWFNEIVK